MIEYLGKHIADPSIFPYQTWEGKERKVRHFKIIERAWNWAFVGGALWGLLMLAKSLGVIATVARYDAIS